MCYLKIIKPFQKIMHTSESKLFKELKNGIATLVGQVVFKLWIKTVKIMFWSTTQEMLGLLKFWCHFWVPSTIYYRPFSHCIDQAGLGAFTAKSGRKHYNPPPLTVMWMNFDSPNFPSFCSLSAIISFQTCSNKCILYVLSFHKCIKIKYKMVNMYGVFRD